MNKRKITWLKKSIVYTFSFNLLICLAMILYGEGIIRDITSAIALFVVYIVSATSFSIVKGASPKPLFYNLSVLITHIVLNIIMLCVLGFIYTGWETAMFWITEMFSMFFMISVLFLDTIISLLKK